MAFMKKKTKQRCKTILSLFFALTLIMSAVTFAVSAAEAAALSVQLKTDKEEYTADEDIALTLEIKNGSTGRLVILLTILRHRTAMSLKAEVQAAVKRSFLREEH